MSVFMPPRLRLPLLGLVCAVLLRGAVESLRMSPAMVTLLALMALALVMLRRDRDSAWALPSGPPGPWRDMTPANAWARNGSRDGRDSGSYPVPRKIVDFPTRRSLGSRVKLWVGGVGLALTGLWWMLLVTILFFPDPGAHDTLYINSGLTLIAISVLLAVLFLVILRSGLRGPADPLAPENNHGEELRDLPLGARGYPAPRSRGRRAHLRLVKPSL